MADNEEGRSHEDLTEEASPQRIEEFRDRGIVSQSREVSAVVAMLAVGIAIYYLLPSLSIQMSEYLRDSLNVRLDAQKDAAFTTMVKTSLQKSLGILLAVGLPICGAGFVFGIIASFLQIGPIFSFEPLTPDFNKINPIPNLLRLVSGKNAIEGVKVLVKAIVLSICTFLLIRSEVIGSPVHFFGDVYYLIHHYSLVSKTIFFSLILVFAIFAAIDFGIQKFQYYRNLRMTKQEAKQEHREREGDPQIRARIRSVQREVAKRRMMQAVKKADVIITNPTHIAVALVYDTKTMSAPRVVAKGADLVAQKIKEIAKEAGIPMVENVPLARTLFKTVKLGRAIPRELYQAVAEVLAHVYRLKKRDM